MNRRIASVGVAVAGALAAALFATPAQASTGELRINFDDPPSGQTEPGPWSTGCFTNVGAVGGTGCIAIGHSGGAVSRTQRPTAGGTSPALQFPPAGAGTAVIAVPNATNLNPGKADFTITALVKITSAETSSGANVVQKGYFTDSQWKLQVDSGTPSCRAYGTNDAGTKVELLAKWTASIADAGWTYISCKRRGTALTITVGDATSDPVVSDSVLDISSDANVTIGGKGTGTNNDQYHGALDNVTFSVG